MRATELLPVLDAFLEVATRTRRERRLAKIIRRTEKALAAGFRKQGDAFLGELSSKLNEAAPPPPPPPPPPVDAAVATKWEPAFTVAAAETLQVLAQPIQGLAAAALEAGARVAIADLALDTSFDLANPAAASYLEDYGARRVTMINETTRDTIRRLVTHAVDEGWSYDRTAKEIKSRFHEFAVGRPQQHIESRAHLVAVQESAEAYEHGTTLVGQDLQSAGIPMEKAWLTAKDDRVSAGCRLNEGAGWIPLDDSFPSGADRPPGHVACRCSGLLRRTPTKE